MTDWSAAWRDRELRVTETVAAIVAAHRAGTARPRKPWRAALQRIRDHNDPAIFISLRDEKDALAEAESACREGCRRSCRFTAFRSR